MKTAQKLVNNLINENIFSLKDNSLRYLRVTNLCQNTYFTYKILQRFNGTCYNFPHVK